MQFSTIQEVEDLHHDKSIKNKSKVSGVYLALMKYVFVINKAVKVNESATSNSTADDSISPFVLRMLRKDSHIQLVNKFRNYRIPSKKQNQNYDNLVDCLTGNMFEHCLGNNVLISRVWFSI
jgi:hypothetical protein